MAGHDETTAPGPAGGVAYLLTGPAHGVRLVVSLASLRRHYDGPVTVYTTQDASHAIGAACAADGRLRVAHRTFPEVRGRRNASFLTKVALLGHLAGPTTVYLDADTLVCGPIDELFGLAEGEAFGVAQFAGWTTARPVIARRIARWRGLAQDRFDKEWLDATVDAALAGGPAVNGGVVAVRGGGPFLRHWRDLALAGRETFICDEIALQLLLAHHRHRLFDCRFNASPTYAAGAEDVRIWHFHGDRHARTGVGRRVWLPAYEACLKEDVAGLSAWAPAGDRRLAAAPAAGRRGAGRPRRAAAVPGTSRPDGPRPGVPAFTTVLAVDEEHLPELRATWPTWRAFRPEILGRPLVVFCDAARPLDRWRRDLAFLDHPDRRLVAWDGPGASQRERMLSAFVLGVATHVTTPWYLKLDADAAALGPGRWIDPDWFRPGEDGRTPVLVAAPWPYTRPAEWLATLRAWADGVEGLAGRPPLALPPPDDRGRARHRRIIGWLTFGETAFARRVAAWCGGRMPVPSQDTLLWYCAARLGELIRTAPMKAYGWHHGPLLGLEERCRAALAAARRPSAGA